LLFYPHRREKARGYEKVRQSLPDFSYEEKGKRYGHSGLRLPDAAPELVFQICLKLKAAGNDEDQRRDGVDGLKINI
jgi:hypothetical protein